MRERAKEKKRKRRRQVEARTAIYPMQSEIIAYHSAPPVSSVKALKRAPRGAQPDRRPWETIAKCTPSPLLFGLGASRPRLKRISVSSVTEVSRLCLVFSSMYFNLTAGWVYTMFKPHHHLWSWQLQCLSVIFILPKDRDKNSTCNMTGLKMKGKDPQNQCFLSFYVASNS